MCNPNQQQMCTKIDHSDVRLTKHSISDHVSQESLIAVILVAAILTLLVLVLVCIYCCKSGGCSGGGCCSRSGGGGGKPSAKDFKPADLER